jgi:serine/threonine protein kinase
MAGSTRYFLEKKIARGGMAEIWLARQIGGDGFQRVCAVKRILPHYAEDAEYVQMFRDEAEICKGLRHANIVRVEGFQAFGPTWGMIMEFVEGTDLRALLHHCSVNKMRLTVPMAVYVAAEAAKGLHHAHTKLDEMTGRQLNIVHRDISPQNILLSFSGEVKVTDFGIADAGSRVTDTRPGIVKGKYSYMSPEQVSAKSVDGRSDVFALGIVLWETLAMTRLFNADSDVETIKQVHECRVPATLRTLNTDVDPALEAIVIRALQRDINRRYESASEFERELRRYLGQRYPDFTSEDLSRFLGSVLAKRKSEVAGDIRNLLSQPVPSANHIEPASAPVKRSPPGPGETSAGRPVTPQPTGYRSNQSPQPSLSFSRRQTSMRRRENPVFSFVHPLWLYALALIAGLTGILMFGQVPVPLTAKDPVQIVGKGNIYSAQIAVNGKSLFRGGYKRVPVGLRLPPGRHLITAHRDGYFSDQVEVEVKSGSVLEEIKFNLRPKADFARVAVSANWATSPTVVVRVNDGFYVAKLSSGANGNGTQEALPDLSPGKEYTVTAATVEDGGLNEVACRFTPERRADDRQTVLHIDFIARNCTVYLP